MPTISPEYQALINKYYEDCGRDYEIVWQLKDSQALHYGYWDAETLTHRQALWNMNLQMALAAGVKHTDTVLDAGCGVGGSCFFMAREFGARARGITIVQAQVDQARVFASRLGLTDQVDFSVQDYSNTTFPDASFDLIWAQESACHAQEKADFLKEAYRLLKPGGRLVMADYFCRPLQDDTEKSLLRKWGDSWSIQSFIEEAAFNDKLEEMGFKTLVNNDISDYVFPSVKLMHRAYYPGWVMSKTANLLGKSTARRLLHTKSGLFQYQAFQKGIWRHKILVAGKDPVLKPGKMPNRRVPRLPLPVFPSELFPVFTQNRLHWKNLLKRVMHAYLETGIRDPRRRF